MSGQDKHIKWVTVKRISEWVAFEVDYYSDRTEAYFLLLTTKGKVHETRRVEYQFAREPQMADVARALAGKDILLMNAWLSKTAKSNVMALAADVKEQLGMNRKPTKHRRRRSSSKFAVAPLPATAISPMPSASGRSEIQLTDKLSFVQTTEGAFFKAGKSGNIPTCLVRGFVGSPEGLLNLYNANPTSYGNSAIRQINQAVGIDDKTDAIAAAVFQVIIPPPPPYGLTPADPDARIVMGEEYEGGDVIGVLPAKDRLATVAEDKVAAAATPSPTPIRSMLSTLTLDPISEGEEGEESDQDDPIAPLGASGLGI